MDMKMQAFLDKVKDMADKTGKVSRHAAGVAGKKANDLALATRINLQIFDLNTECEALYKEIGKLVYDLHRGAEVTNEEMDEKMAQVDAKQEKLAVLRDKLAEMRSVTACPHCGKPCGKDDAYCSSCGAVYFSSCGAVYFSSFLQSANADFSSTGWEGLASISSYKGFCWYPGSGAAGFSSFWKKSSRSSFSSPHSETLFSFERTLLYVL